MESFLLLIVLMLLWAPSQPRRLAKTGKIEEIEFAEDLDEPEGETVDRTLPDEDETGPCLETITVYTDPNDLYFNPYVMQVTMIDTALCFDEDLTFCTSDEGKTEYADSVCQIIDPCFDEEGCLSYALCNHVVTEETLGVVMTGSGTAEFDLTVEDAPITGTSEFLFMLPDVAGKITSVFEEDIATHTVCYTWFA